MSYTRDRVGQKAFNIATTSRRVTFRVVVVAESHGYANGKRTEWNATVFLRFDNKRLFETTTVAAQPPGVDLDDAGDTDLWSALNLTNVTTDLIEGVQNMARGPMAQVLEFGKTTLSDKTRSELEIYQEFERHTQHLKWVSAPDQVIVDAANVNVGDMVVKRNYYGNIIRYAPVEAINTDTDDNGDVRYQFVHAPDAPHPTSGWYWSDTLKEIIRAR